MKKILCVGKIKKGQVTLTVDRETLRQIALNEMNSKILMECFLAPEGGNHVSGSHS